MGQITYFSWNYSEIVRPDGYFFHKGVQKVFYFEVSAILTVTISLGAFYGIGEVRSDTIRIAIQAELVCKGVQGDSLEILSKYNAKKERQHFSLGRKVEKLKKVQI